MERATNEEVRRMLAKPCSVCGKDNYYYTCHGTEEAKVIGEKMCPIHAASLLKDCCMANPESHKAA
mgnify:CR=1 FL=1